MTPQQRENVRKWVEALRSGKYQQGEGALRIHTPGEKDRFCCLGVACDALNPEGWHSTEGFGDEHVGFTFREHGIEYDTPPREFMADVLGIDNPDPVLLQQGEVEGGALRATYVNDELAWGFEKIADLVEAKYLADDSRNLEP